MNENTNREKLLGKVTDVDVKLIRRCFLGIDFRFKMEGSGVSSGGKYTVNISPECKYNSDDHRRDAYAESFKTIADFLKETGKDRVQDLEGLPVEVTLEGNTFKDFRFLTECI